MRQHDNYPTSEDVFEAHSSHAQTWPLDLAVRTMCS